MLAKVSITHYKSNEREQQLLTVPNLPVICGFFLSVGEGRIKPDPPVGLRRGIIWMEEKGTTETFKGSWTNVE